MTREEIYDACLQAMTKSKCLLVEAATGYGKSKLSIDLINNLCNNELSSKHTRMLLLVAKRVHKVTWKEEIEKWGGLKVDEVVMECYESLHKHTGEHFDVVLADECFRGDTEILTNSGYKQFKDLTEEDLVAQFTQEGNIEFVKPLRLIKRRHTGEICKLHLGRERYCYLTPNHNMVYKTPWVDGWRMKPVSELCQSNYTKIPVSGHGTGDNSLLTPLERLLIAIQADGTLQRHQVNESVYSIQVTKARKRERLQTLLSEYSTWTSIKGKDETDRYMIKVPKGDAKLLSTHFSVNMGYDRANDFINEIIQWDGHDPKKGNYLYYSSKVKENVDFVVAVAIQAGYKALSSVENDYRKKTFSPIYRVFMRKVESVDTQPMTKEYLSYDDDVYCVEVPTHMIVVRSEGYSFIAGNCHHIASDKRTNELDFVNFDYFIGLSATIPRKVKSYFRSGYHSQVVSCTLNEAIEDDILPEPKIVLFPLQVENTRICETIELNPKSPGPIIEDVYNNIWKYKRTKQHAILKCTQRQKLNHINSLIDWKKKKVMAGNVAMEKTWLYHCGKRLELLADWKVEIIRLILNKLKSNRTITFCKTIEQAEKLGKWCIHSKNGKATQYYDDFNAKKIHHITAVNILNENANLVDCKYALFCNLSSSEIVQIQRVGRALRHKSPVILIPYYEGTREEEIVKKSLEGFSPDIIRTIHSINEL